MWCVTRWPPATTRRSINFAFVEDEWERDFASNDNPIRLLNPIASQLAVMRSTLLGGLVDKRPLQRSTARPRVCACSKWAGCSCVTDTWRMVA